MIGYDIFEAYKIKWRMLHGAIVPFSLPDKRGPVISNNQAKDILQKKRAFFIRWESNFDCNNESEWWHIIKTEDVGMENVSGSTRSKIRRGLKIYKAEKCSKEVIIKNGYNVYLSAYSRYSTFEYPIAEKEFVQSICNMPENIEFWGVFDLQSEELVSFSENILDKERCFYSTIWFNPESLKNYSSYVLFFEMNKSYLFDRNFRYVSDGARSIKHITNIHDFLQDKFGFRKAYTKLNIIYAPSIYAVVSCLYPIKNILKRFNFRRIEKLNVLLEQERIRRACISLIK